MAYNFLTSAISEIGKVLQEVFNPTTGHDHDGVNSKAVTTGTPASGALAASAGGRAIMAADYFDAATVLAKFAADSFDNAQLIKAIKDGAFNADAATRALFDDGIWPLAKLAATAKYQTILYNVEDLGAGVDITDRPIYFVPTGLATSLVSADIIPLGNPAGIDDSNKCTIKLTDGTNIIVEKEFDADPAFPSAGTVTNLGALDGTHKNLAAGEKLTLSVTNGTTANPPAFTLQIIYTLADA
jgi:hypothetical protein